MHTLLSCIFVRATMFSYHVNKGKRIHKHTGETKSNVSLSQQTVYNIRNCYTICNLIFIVLDVNSKCYSISRLVDDQVEKLYRS